MAHSRKLLTVGALGVAALALIGTGAGATFSDAVHATQSVKAGTLNMTVSSAASGASISTDRKTVTFAAVGPVGSSFTTGPQLVTATNSGDITARAITLRAADTNTNATLKGQLYVTITSSGQVAYDGLLAGLESSPINIQGDVAPGATDPFDVTFYAGQGSTPSLTNGSQGGSVTPTITVDYQG